MSSPLLGWHFQCHPLPPHHSSCAPMLASVGSHLQMKPQVSPNLLSIFMADFKPLPLNPFLNLLHLIMQPSRPSVWSFSPCILPWVGSSPHLRGPPTPCKLRCCTSHHLPIFPTSFLTSINTWLSSPLTLSSARLKFIQPQWGEWGAPGWGKLWPGRSSLPFGLSSGGTS